MCKIRYSQNSFLHLLALRIAAADHLPPSDLVATISFTPSLHMYSFATSLKSSSSPPAWQLLLQNLLPSISTIPTLHMSKRLNMSCRSFSSATSNTASWVFYPSFLLRFRKIQTTGKKTTSVETHKLIQTTVNKL